MKIHELQSQITRQGLAPLYLVIGEEPYFRDHALTAIHDAVQSSSDFGKGDEPSTENVSAEFTADVVYGDETDASEILGLAAEISFFSSIQNMENCPKLRTYKLFKSNFKHEPYLDLQ